MALLSLCCIFIPFIRLTATQYGYYWFNAYEANPNRQNIFGHGSSWLAADFVPNYKSPHFRQNLLPTTRDKSLTTATTATTTATATASATTTSSAITTAIRATNFINEKEIYEKKAFLGRVSTEITIVDSSEKKNRAIESNHNVTEYLRNSSQSVSAGGNNSIITVKGLKTKTIKSNPDLQSTTEIVQRQEEVNATTEGTRESTERCVTFELLEGIAEFSKGLLKFVALSFDEEE